MAPSSQPPAGPLDPRTVAIVDAISRPRLQPYLTATGGNVRDAVRLYQWNVDLSGAAYESLHLFEVALRNAMDTQLRLWNATQTERGTGRTHTDEWLTDPARLLVRLVGDDLRKATSRASKAARAQGRSPRHDDIVAQLTLGTWRYLLPDHDPGRRRLWSDALHRSFPNFTDSSGDLLKLVAGVHRIRNRVAHLEPLLSSGLARREFNAMRLVLSGIDPQVEQWFVSRQRITSVLKARPV